MPNRANLELLRDAATRGDWKGTAEAYLELALEVKQSGDKRDLSALEWALRLQNAESVRAIVGEWLWLRLETCGHCADTAAGQ